MAFEILGGVSLLLCNLSMQVSVVSFSGILIDSLFTNVGSLYNDNKSPHKILKDDFSNLLNTTTRDSFSMF